MTNMSLEVGVDDNREASPKKKTMQHVIWANRYLLIFINYSNLPLPHKYLNSFPLITTTNNHHNHNHPSPWPLPWHIQHHDTTDDDDDGYQPRPSALIMQYYSHHPPL